MTERTPLWQVRAGVRWGLQHGLVRGLLARATREGDPQARLIVDPAVRDDPYPVQEEVRARGPLVRGRLTWVTADHAVCQEVLRSPDFAAGMVDSGLPPAVRRVHRWSHDPRAVGPLDPPSMLAVEGPDHTRSRRLVAKVFTARAVEQLRPQVQAVADELLDELARTPAGQPVDLVGRYATLLPVRVICRILGVPADQEDRVLALGNGVAPSLDLGIGWPAFLQVQRALHDFNDWLDEHLRRLRADPGPDLLSQLVLVEDEGARLDHVELRTTAGLLLAAGFETTVNLLGNGAQLLLADRDQLAVLQAEPARWPDAVEEVLRYESPVQVTGRGAVRDTTVAGLPVAAGAHVTTLLAAANRDPRVFADPGRFDVTRDNAREHLAFSAGRHFCVGAALARVEGEVGLRSLFERFPSLTAAPGARRRPTRVLRGWDALPVVPVPVPARARS
jgi:cytochrome P450